MKKVFPGIVIIATAAIFYTLIAIAPAFGDRGRTPVFLAGVLVLIVGFGIVFIYNRIEFGRFFMNKPKRIEGFQDEAEGRGYSDAERKMLVILVVVAFIVLLIVGVIGHR